MDDKLARVERAIAKWALDDKAQGGAAIDTLIKIMEILDFDPYPEDETDDAQVAAAGSNA